MSRNLSIFICHSLYAPHIIGGAEVSTQILAETLNERYDVKVVTVGPQHRKAGPMHDEINSVEIIRLPRHNLYWFGDHTTRRNVLSRTIWRLIDSFNFNHYRAFRKLLASYQPALIHTQNLTGLSLAIWKAAHDCGIPVIHTLRDHSLLDPIGNRLYAKLYRIMSVHFSKYVHVVIGISDHILRQHVQRGLFASADAYVIPNVVEGKPASAKPGHEGPLQIGYFGQLVEIKGVQYLIEAVKQLPSNIVGRLTICGEGPYKERLIESCVQDPRICFTGKLDRDETNKMMRAVDVTIVPSIWEEPFGRVIIESYQQGTPVFATKVGGIPEVIMDPDHDLILPRNAESISEAIRRYHSMSKQEKQAVSERCVQHSLKFDASSSLQSHLQVYKRSLSHAGERMATANLST